MSKLDRIDRAAARFLQKANRKNEPLEAFRATDDYKELEGAFKDTIQKQAKYVADHMPDWMYTLQQWDEDRVSTWLEDNMPTVDNYIDHTWLFEKYVMAFVYSVKATYNRHGVSVAKAATQTVEFELTNPQYIDALMDQANYLLNKSKMDDTTRTRMITFIRDMRLSASSLSDLANALEDEFESVSTNRSFLIANTESNQAMSTAQDAFLRENGFATKQWVGAGPSTCDTCQGNEDQGPIPLDADFESGDSHPPAHPNCECYEDAGDEIDLDTIDVLWDGS